MNEVRVAYDILKSLGLREHGPTLISCPTCGRTRISLEKLALEVERRLADVEEPITVAVMGCVVNGPGEARELTSVLPAASARDWYSARAKSCARFPKISL